MKDTIVQALKSKVGLTDEQANKAADVMMEIAQAKMGGAVPDVGKLAGSLPGGLGGLLGGKSG